MLVKAYGSYKKLLDEKLENTTILVLIITLLIISVGLFIPNNQSFSYMKNNTLEILKKTENIITIDGKQYFVYFKEVK